MKGIIMVRYFVLVIALFVCSSAEAYDQKRIEQYCESKKANKPDTEWCIIMEQESGKLFDEAFATAPSDKIKKRIVQCLQKSPKSYDAGRPCLTVLFDELIGTGLAASKSTETPYFDTIAYCTRVKAAAGGSYQMEKGCRESERDARGKIENSIVPQDVMNYCRNVGETAGGSYLMMSGCIEQELAAKASMQ